MKAVILAGGLGTRLSEETEVRPKPMVEVGGRPMLWHIMKIYSAHGINEFIVCLGYKGYAIKQFFANYFLHTSDVTFDVANNRMEVHQCSAEPWRVTLLDTGEATLTGGRIKRIADHLPDDEPFCLTYGDGVSNVDIAASVHFHRQHGRLVTMTVVSPPGRFGAVALENGLIHSIQEKPAGDGGAINGGFFVLSKKALSYIDGDETSWEQEPLRLIAADRELMAWRHAGFWQCMDTLRDKQLLESLWRGGAAPWKIW